MSWPAALLTRRRRVFALFVLAELTLVMAIPFLAIAGYHTLLGSQAGTFIEEPEEGDPGWRALVAPSPITAVVETEGGALTGLALLVGPVDGPSVVVTGDSEVELAAARFDAGVTEAGGTVIVVPGTLVVDDSPLAARSPDDAVAAVETMLRLEIDTVDVVDEGRWSSILGPTTYRLANPDPVVDDEGRPLLEVGEIEVGAGEAAAFLGRPAPDSDPITLLFRRQLFWTALTESPPGADEVDDELTTTLHTLVGPGSQVVILPLVDVVPDPEPDLSAAEALIREVVPIPAGAHPGDRLQVRILDRTGAADLESIAADVASTGSEVVEIGYAQDFDGGLTHLVVPPGVAGPAITELATLTGATTVLDNDIEDDAVVTLLVGSDYGVAAS